jgi:hypothetical protein
MLKDEVPYAFGREGLGAWGKDYSFGEAMVNDNKNRVKSFGRGQISDKIH